MFNKNTNYRHKIVRNSKKTFPFSMVLYKRICTYSGGGGKMEELSVTLAIASLMVLVYFIGNAITSAEK